MPRATLSMRFSGKEGATLERVDEAAAVFLPAPCLKSCQRAAPSEPRMGLATCSSTSLKAEKEVLDLVGPEVSAIVFGTSVGVWQMVRLLRQQYFIFPLLKFFHVVLFRIILMCFIEDCGLFYREQSCDRKKNNMELQDNMGLVVWMIYTILHTQNLNAPKVQ